MKIVLAILASVLFASTFAYASSDVYPSYLTIEGVEHLTGCLESPDSSTPLCPEPATVVTLVYSLACYENDHGIYYSWSYNSIGGVRISATALVSSNLVPGEPVCLGIQRVEKKLTIAGLFDEDQLILEELRKL